MTPRLRARLIAEGAALRGKESITPEGRRLADKARAEREERKRRER